MANVKNFSFETQIQVGYLKNVKGNKTPDYATVQITGQYSPDKCSREHGVDFDIEEVWGGYWGEGQQFVKSNDLTVLFRACEIYEGPVSDKIKERTTKHIEYLTGYSTPDMVLDMPEEMPDIAEPIAKITFPNPDTLKTKSA